MHRVPYLLFCAALVAAPAARAGADADPETVLVRYNVAPGKEKAFRAAIAAEWALQKRMHLTTDAPRTLVRGQDASGGTYYVEIFTWVSPSIPDHAPPELKAVWKDLNAACPGDAKSPGIDFSEVDLVTP